MVDARAALQRQTLQVAGYSLEVGEAVEHPFGYHPVLYARHVVDTSHDEGVFLAAVTRELQTMEIRVKKMLPGKSNILATPQGPCITRSLLVVDLQPNDALKLQSRGLGSLRRLGCGLFIPHKTLANANHDL
jgi:CRISPR-associated protein Cas6